MVALHAWRSAAAIARFAEIYPGRALVVAITGTDAYRFIHSHPEATLRSIALADRLVGLHDLIGETVPPEHRAKVRVIYQSARPIAARRPASAASGLRRRAPARKDRCVPPCGATCRPRVGCAWTTLAPPYPDWRSRRRADNNEPALRWRRVPRHLLRRVYGRAHLLVLPSRWKAGPTSLRRSGGR
jgi:hypothetical protein